MTAEKVAPSGALDESMFSSVRTAISVPAGRVGATEEDNVDGKGDEEEACPSPKVMDWMSEML